MKKVIIILIIISSLIVVSFSFHSGDKEKINYELFTVKRGDIRTTITATGTIEPITQVEVGTQVSGTIARLHADYNSIVKKGQLIAELDRTLLESEYNSQLATSELNQNEFDYQEKNYKRVEGLYAKKLVSDSEYETAKYQYEKAFKALKKTRFDLNKAKTNLNYCMIYSPVDGVVLSRSVDEGQTVAATFSTPKLFTIAEDLRKMRVIADIDEADIGQVVEGQKVIFSVDAFPDDHFEGTVSQVRLEPQVTSNVVTYEVVINAPNPDLKLKPGLTANITVLTSEKDNVLMIPLRALRFQPEEEQENVAKTGENKSVWIQARDHLECRNVRTGFSDGIFIEVQEGLQEGDQVATGVLAAENVSKSPKKNKGGNPLMPNMTGERPH